MSRCRSPSAGPAPTARASAGGSARRPYSSASARATASPSWVPDPRPLCAGIAPVDDEARPAAEPVKAEEAPRELGGARGIRALAPSAASRARGLEQQRRARAPPRPARRTGGPARRGGPAPRSGAAPRPRRRRYRDADILGQHRHRLLLARAGGLVHDDLQRANSARICVGGDEVGAGGQDRRLEHGVAGAVEAEELPPDPRWTTRVSIRERGGVSSIDVTSSSRQEQAASSTTPRTTSAGNARGTAGCEIAALREQHRRRRSG